MGKPARTPGVEQLQPEPVRLAACAVDSTTACAVDSTAGKVGELPKCTGAQGSRVNESQRLNTWLPALIYTVRGWISSDLIAIVLCLFSLGTKVCNFFILQKLKLRDLDF